MYIINVQFCSKLKKYNTFEYFWLNYEYIIVSPVYFRLELGIIYGALEAIVEHGIPQDTHILAISLLFWNYIV